MLKKGTTVVFNALALSLLAPAFASQIQGRVLHVQGIADASDPFFDLKCPRYRLDIVANGDPDKTGFVAPEIMLEECDANGTPVDTDVEKKREQDLSSWILGHDQNNGSIEDLIANLLGERETA